MLPEYKPSRFTIVEPLNEQDQAALFNTMTKAVGTLPAHVWEEARTGSCKHESTVRHLLNQGFLVPADTDENLVLAHWRHQRAYDLTHLRYHINPTHGCEMRCSNCYFGQTEKIRQMSRETARSVLDFITTDLEQKRPVSAHLDFGEPATSLNPEIILYLAEGLHRFCHGRRILFKISLTTNGLDLKPDIIEGLKPFGLTRVRVKIGGPMIIHDHLRPAKDGSPTYEQIMDNLSAMAGLIEIHLISQYDPNQDEHLLYPALLNDLILHGLGEYIAAVSFQPGFPGQNSKDASGPKQVGWPDCLIDTNAERRAWLKDQIAAWGFSSPAKPPAWRCIANNQAAMVIDVDGQITACPFQIDSPELNYGHVKTGIDFYRESRLMLRELPEKCLRSCALTPLCDGGCRYLGFLETGIFNSTYCKHQAYEQLLQSYILRTVHSRNFEHLNRRSQYSVLSSAL
ncbi:MAG: SPASM domain-containing protein [Deltaproteobacteria bacterium]|nr:SPASM domain-containing protein [Deltaproteobacteria bacterium]